MKSWKDSNKEFTDYLNVYNKASAELSRKQKRFLENVFDAGALADLQNEQRKFDAVNEVYLRMTEERKQMMLHG
jgi:hypothetical protein